MSFDKHSNFNKQANFTEVKFGENKPVLEVELNELQQIQNEARADIIRDSIPSGFTQLGDIDYEYCLNNENQIKLKTDSVAYVNGYRINIPKDTIIDIGKAPEKDAREDLLFLEVWKEEVNSTSELTLEGGEGQVEIPNNIKDSRYPIETTHRVALKWRIRHVAGVDFNSNRQYAQFIKDFSTIIFIQGSLDKPSAMSFVDSVYLKEVANTISDVGLWRCASPRPDLEYSIDGYCYAIPMFRLYRKPSCGKSIPFEYSKINPKVDYSKFTKLMQEEKVERVVNENIKGRSLVNLLKSNIGKMPLTNFNNSFWGREFNYAIELKRQSTYTLILDFSLDANYPQLDSIILGTVGTSDTTSNYRLWGVKTGRNKLSFTVPSDFTMRGVEGLTFVIEKTNLPSAPILTIDNFMILEGDWTNREIPEYFEGLKSLGEDDGNLITIKNEILNDDTYDINDGNQKLLAFSEVTHVNSTNTIIPTIEANVIKGEESTPLEKLGSKLETEGHEVIEFTKIKGKTIQNLVNVKDKQFTIGQNINANICPTLKLDTWYTILIYVSNNTLDAPIRFSGFSFGAGAGAVFHSDSTFTGDINIIKAKETGLWRGKARLSTLGSNPTPMFTLFAENPTSGSYTASAMVLEGDHMNTPLEDLPFVEGIKSVGENEGNVIEILSQGKNLCKSFDKWTLHANSKLVSSSEILVTNVGRSDSPKIKAKPNTQYTVQYEGDSARCFIRELDNFGSEIRYTVSTDNTFIVTTGDDCEYIDFSINPSSSESFPKTIKNIIISNGHTPSQYQPYCENKTQIPISVPLRSLPNGVCDELVGNKVIRRVGKVILDGSIDIRVDTAFNQSNTIAFVINNPGLRNKDNGSLLSSVLPPVDGDTYWNTDIECIMSANELYFKFRVLKTKLDSLDNDGIKKWLKSNPITVYYELLNPIDEYLENVYEKESIKTYQLDAPLRSLPNGVKDEIKDGVLIRRCGEIILDGSEEWKEPSSDKPTEESGFIRFNSPITGSKKSSYCLCDKFKYETGATVALEKIYITATPNISITVPKSKIANIEALKVWLQTNPTKVIYELETPVEISLKEVKPQNANFSLQRQFGEGNWLRELPNGVKDTVENGKVIRRVGKVVLNGSETWQFDQGNMLKDTLMFSSPLVCSSTSNYVLSNKFDSDNTLDNGWETDTETICVVLGSKIRIRILKSKLATQDVRGLTTWLQQNPTTVLYELATPVEETLSTDNYMSYPSHEFNTYCGSMYVGEGRNYVISDNKMPTEDTIVVETDFREIEGKAKVEDCNFKKNDEGYDTPYISSSSKNLLDISTSNILTKDYSKNYRFNYTESNNGFTISNNTANSYASIRFRVYLKAGVSYRIEYAQTGPYSFVDLKTLGLEFICNLNSNRVFKVTNSDYYSVNFYCTGSVSTTSTATFTDIRITEGETSVPFEPCNKTTKYLENTESNDIDDLRHQVSLTGFNYDKILNESFDKLLRGEL